MVRVVSKAGFGPRRTRQLTRVVVLVAALMTWAAIFSRRRPRTVYSACSSGPAFGTTSRKGRHHAQSDEGTLSLLHSNPFGSTGRWARRPVRRRRLRDWPSLPEAASPGFRPRHLRPRTIPVRKGSGYLTLSMVTAGERRPLAARQIHIFSTTSSDCVGYKVLSFRGN